MAGGKVVPDTREFKEIKNVRINVVDDREIDFYRFKNQIKVENSQASKKAFLASVFRHRNSKEKL